MASLSPKIQNSRKINAESAQFTLSSPNYLQLFSTLYSFPYVEVPQKQLNQDFSTNMPLKSNFLAVLCFQWLLIYCQCTQKVIFVNVEPPFHLNQTKMVQNKTLWGKKLSGHHDWCFPKKCPFWHNFQRVWVCNFFWVKSYIW